MTKRAEKNFLRLTKRFICPKGLFYQQSTDTVADAVFRLGKMKSTAIAPFSGLNLHDRTSSNKPSNLNTFDFKF